LVYVEDIEVIGPRRAAADDDVETLAESMKKLGLKTPIWVRYFPAPDDVGSDRLVLVAGAHRLAAAKKLGWEEIECVVIYDMADDDARLWEIAENLSIPNQGRRYKKTHKNLSFDGLGDAE
jgi:ParB family chromosome partitioning protein